MSDELATGRVRRASAVAGLAVRTLGGHALASARERIGASGAVDRFHDRNAERYFDVFGRSKGVLMKAAQMTSMVDTSSPDSEFAPYRRALSRLQNEAPGMPGDVVLDTIQSELKQPIDRVFAEISADPVATASIGQVHVATLVDGRRVAVKVQYPGVAAAIRADLANTELLVAFWQMIQAGNGVRVAGLREIAAGVAERIAAEVDYRQEAANIAAVHSLYGDHPFIRVPELIAEASGDRVLTMTYVDGLDWSDAQQADAELKNSWAEVIFRFMAGSYRNGSLYQGDPHPWNFRFGTDGTVGFVDFGCVATMTERYRRAIVEIGRHTYDGRPNELHQVMVEAGFLPDPTALSPAEVMQWWRDMLQELVGPQPVTYSTESISRLMSTFADARSEDHPQRHLVPPREFVMMSRIEFGHAAIFGGLNATFHSRAVMDELDGVAPPLTPLGHVHDEWVRRRGLPYGMQAR
ncbi:MULTISPECIES: AarF/ABC1/UbiB kinase family protein [unclassified Mycolicibacterium]|uniref:ABC1 kinase family protein n=2 Tax=Mycolicibacterium TaxID=1866885 RepID=UPI002814D9BD|nr:MULTISPECIES: AarF/ABC1/UbiB kinase family protein [unclassified Mycolicibacterium]